MEFGHDNVRQVVQDDRLSRLPDDLLHKILSCFDMKFVVQTCLVSTRWKHLWTSMPCLNFSSWQFGTLPKFAKFVTKVLSHRNHQIEVSVVKLDFRGAVSQVFVRQIAKYAFSHNVQQLSVASCPKKQHEFSPCLFSSQSLKHFTLTIPLMSRNFITLDKPLDFPALTTMHLDNIRFCGDIFSKCVNLKNLTLQDFSLQDVEVLDIINSCLSNLMLNNCNYVKVINLIAPQLENLTLIACPSMEHLNAPLLYKNGFHSLNKVTVCMDPSWTWPCMPSEVTRKTIRMLQQLHSAKHLTLSAYVIQCLSSFPKLLSPLSSPFSNLISLTINSSKTYDAHKLKMSTEARNFLLDNSPDATLILKSLEVPSRS